MIAESLLRLERYLRTVPRAFATLSEQERLTRPTDKWSKQEILGHLVDSAQHNWQRLHQAPIAEGAYQIQSYSQEHLVRINAYQKQAASTLAKLWQTMNQQFLTVAKGLSPSQLRKEVYIPYTQQKTDLAFIVNDYVTHLEHHLQQIFGDLGPLQKEEGWLITVEEAKQALKDQNSLPYIILRERETLKVEYYAPKLVDLQTPHDQDELYVITSGTGTYYCDGWRKPCAVGDILFVPAEVEHRFENFSADFACWVIFYGAKGGEIPFS